MFVSTKNWLPFLLLLACHCLILRSHKARVLFGCGFIPFAIRLKSIMNNHAHTKTCLYHFKWFSECSTLFQKVRIGVERLCAHEHTEEHFIIVSWLTGWLWNFKAINCVRVCHDGSKLSGLLIIIVCYDRLNECHWATTEKCSERYRQVKMKTKHSNWSVITYIICLWPVFEMP